MNKTIKFIIFCITILGISFCIPNFTKAATPVTDESSLLSAISSVSDGETITNTRSSVHQLSSKRSYY